MAVRKNLKSKVSSELLMASVAFQDHITRTLLYPDFSLSDPFLRHTRRASTGSQTRQKTKDKAPQTQAIQEEREYVLDSTPPPLSLAQKLGLVACPQERLSEDEWSQVKARSVQQEESAQPCTICREDFRLQPQVLLSCSHIFHRTCLKAFERFSERKCCPMCRREHYETRVIHDAARLYRHKCATRIQAYWRGYVARKWYKNVKKTTCPKDSKLRRKFFEAKLQELNDSFVRYCHTDTEAFLSDIDRSLSSSRRVFQQLERKSLSEPQENHWDKIKSQVIQRGVWDCPICLTAVRNPDTQSQSVRSNHCRPSVLLSCSHMFHQPCFEAFESFNTFTAGSRPTCPLCRSTYKKKII